MKCLINLGISLTESIHSILLRSENLKIHSFFRGIVGCTKNVDAALVFEAINVSDLIFFIAMKCKYSSFGSDKACHVVVLLYLLFDFDKFLLIFLFLLD